MTLEEKLGKAFSEFELSEESQISINRYLDLMKAKDIETYEHSIRVGLDSAKIGKYMHLDGKALLFAGTLHDVGKLGIEPEILRKKDGFNEDDMKKIRKHPEYAYYLLRGIHEYSAYIVRRHHKNQKDGYPKRLTKEKISFSKSSIVVLDFLALLVSLADVYDALTTRENCKFGEKRKFTPEEAKKLLIEENEGLKVLIEELFKDKILGSQE